MLLLSCRNVEGGVFLRNRVATWATKLRKVILASHVLVLFLFLLIFTLFDGQFLGKIFEVKLAPSLVLLILCVIQVWDLLHLNRIVLIGILARTRWILSSLLLGIQSVSLAFVCTEASTRSLRFGQLIGGFVVAGS